MIDDISPPGSWAKELAARPHTYRDVWAALLAAEARAASLEASWRNASERGDSYCAELAALKASPSNGWAAKVEALVVERDEAEARAKAAEARLDWLLDRVGVEHRWAKTYSVFLPMGNCALDKQASIATIDAARGAP